MVSQENGAALPSNILVWASSHVMELLNEISMDKYSPEFESAQVTGEILCVLDHDSMRDLGVKSVGHRLIILRAIWEYKKNCGMRSEGWTPPSATIASSKREKDAPHECTINQETHNEHLQSLQQSIAYQEAIIKKLEAKLKSFEESQGQLQDSLSSRDSLVKKQDSRLRSLEESCAKVSNWSEICEKDIKSLKKATRHIPELKMTLSALPLNSGLVTTPVSTTTAHPMSYSSIGASFPPAIRSQFPQSPSLRVITEDSCEKVLKDQMRKQGITEPWEQHVLFLKLDPESSGTPTTAGGRSRSKSDRCFSLDEYPLTTMQQYKDENRYAEFEVRHKRDLVSPVVRLSRSNGHRRNQSYSKGGSRAENRVRMPTLGPDDGISWAFAFFAHQNPREDELEFRYSDSFLIFKKEMRHGVMQGFAQKDLLGTGAVDALAPTGWVPMTCLLETYSPVPPSTSRRRQLDFTYVPATATVLLDFNAGSSSEMSLKKDEEVSVFKQLSYWYFVAKKNGPELGWAPSWHLSHM